MKRRIQGRMGTHGWRRIAGVVAAVLFTLGPVWGQEQPLLVVDGDTTTAGEFLYSYRKNREVRAGADTLTVGDFLDSYIIYRLKVADARRLGLDTLRTYKAEYARYRNARLASALLSIEEVEASYRAAYARCQREVDASHILVAVTEGRDDSAALRKARGLRAQLQAGADFAELARRESDDMSARRNGGRLGYFSAFTMIAPFEAAAFSTAVGAVSEPVRSQYGYHLIKVHDVRPSRGRMRVAHVMVPVAVGATEGQRDSARGVISRAYEEVKSGVSFDTVMMRYSPSIYAAGASGRVPWVRAGSVPDWFADRVFSLQEDGVVSEPFESPMGWHMVKRIAHETVPPYNEARDRLRMLMRQAGESVDDEAAFVRAARRSVGAREYDSVVAVLAQWCSQGEAGELLPGALSTLRVGEVAGRPLCVSDFCAWARAERVDIMGLPPAALRRFVTQYVDGEAIECAAAREAVSDRQFAYLIREFHDGLLLFDVSDRKVWSASLSTEEALRGYYDAHAAELYFDTCYVVEEYRAASEAPLARAARKFHQGRSRRLSKRAMRRDGVECRELRLGANHPLVRDYGAAGDGRGGLSWRGSCLGPVESRGEYRLYRVEKRLTREPMRYEESVPLIRERLQQERERAWVASLRSELRVEVNEPALAWVEEQLEAMEQ